MINLYMLILSTGIMTLAVEKAMRIFFEKRKTTLPIAVLTYLLFWGAMISQYWLPILLYIFLLSLTLAVITLNYEASVIKRLLAFSGSYVILILSTAMFRFFLFILPHEMLPILGDIAYLLTIITTYLLVLLAFQRFTYIKKDMVYSNKLLLPLCFITIVDLISTALLPLNIPNHIEIYYTIVHIGITFIIFYLHNSISKSYGESIKSALHAQEKEYYFTQCQLMQASVENTKSLRHDMKLHLATAREFVSSDKTDEATAYLTGLLGNIEESGVYSNTQNTAFDSIINFKLNNAKDENIKLDIRLLIPPALNIEVADIVTIIGNLLDNALDA
ncbi:MAG: hypothetical protein FWB88_13175, partial [Defluviitaleaceae bacterium]|nr:hypothetical protein [Defluviitaleaceae bacterium]